jgi:dTMP kinase
MRQGFSISVEGVDGCGKDTAIGLLKAELEAAGHEVVVLADLYDTELGINVRSIFIESETPPDDITTMLLITAARRELIRQRILPAIYQNKVVLLNRFKDSTIAYQCFARAPKNDPAQSLAENIALGPHMAATLESIQICGQCDYTPSHTLLINIDIDKQIERLRDRGKLDRYDAAGPEWQSAVRAGFNYVLEQDTKNNRFGRNRITTIDNSSLTLEQLKEEVAEYAKIILKKEAS